MRLKNREHFHPRSAVRLSGNKQGLIFYLCRNYASLSPRKQAILDECFDEAGGEYAAALKAYMTTAESSVKICLEHYIGSENTLHILARRFYECFPIERFFR